MTDFILVLNPGEPISGASTPFSVSDILSTEIDELLEVANKEGFGKQKQEALKRLVCSDVVSFCTALMVLRCRLSSVMVYNV